jgi:pyrroloquinoline quinone (PQQ) biosynthesis protein C
MISTALRTDIEAWASRKDDKPLLKMAEEGRLTKAMVHAYITSVTWMIHRTPGYLARARDRARELGDQPLAEYFEKKRQEETGHGEWGDADVASFSRMAVASADGPVPAMTEIARFVEEITGSDPALYLTYIAFTEYVTVIVGPSLLSNIEERCDVPRSSMTVVDNHIELDRDHAEEAFGIIDDLVGDPRRLRPLRDALATVFALFERFVLEVTLVDDAVPSERHISAA